MTDDDSDHPTAPVTISVISIKTVRAGRLLALADVEIIIPHFPDDRGIS
jgi:hypothetical protein